jgi:outer membrane protein OmpA-like peptidoglycan-associated protein/BMFP domain-containing protein YqiC
MTYRLIFPLIILGILLSLGGGLLAQPTESAQSQEQTLTEAAAALEHTRKSGVEFLSPDHYARALDAYKDARKLMDKKGSADLIHIKLVQYAEEMDQARKAAANARDKLSDLLAARSAALDARADSLSKPMWEKADVRTRSLMRDLERTPGAINQRESEDIRGIYRAARRESLRIQALKDARDKIAAIEKRNGVKTVPVILLRAQQAMSRAEANLAQENLDTARVQGQEAATIATHALALLDYIEAAQRTRTPWETALLPYDDLLEETGNQLGSRLDFKQGGAATGPQLRDLIDRRQDSLLALTASQQQQIASLESSLGEAQTHLSEAQSRLSELENRLRVLDSTRISNRTAEEKALTLKDRMARAADLFKPGEAQVLQDSSGQVIIRLAGTVFPTGATKLDKARQKIVDRAADAIQQFPGASIRVYGYTDSTGSADENLTLSKERAQAIAEYLTAKLNAAPNQITFDGFGASQFVAPNESASDRALNRRIDLILGTSGK